MANTAFFLEFLIKKSLLAAENGTLKFIVFSNFYIQELEDIALKCYRI
jgi:hypothetical protein